MDAAQRALHPLWSSTLDGSLRNGGVEFITTGGKGGEVLHQAFERMVSMLERTNYDASFRCSTHMHLNMLDFTVNQVVRYLLVYAACEPVIFQHCGSYRKTSNFCTTVADSLPFHKKLISRMYDDTVATRVAAQSTVKYTALNLQPLFGDGRHTRALGTVEFRGGRAMTTMGDFLTLANLLLSIKLFVRTFVGTEEEMLARLSDGVMNTVYASGCAAGLEAPIDEMENALIHSWMLLKAYQTGMTKKPAKEKTFTGRATFTGVPNFQSFTPEVDNAPTPARRSVEDMRRRGHVNSGQGPYTIMESNLTAEHLPFTAIQWRSLHENLSFLQDVNHSVVRKATRAMTVFNDPTLRNRPSHQNAGAAILKWALKASDIGFTTTSMLVESTPIGTMLRVVQFAATGQPEAVHHRFPVERQPQLNVGQLQVDYRSRANRMLQGGWNQLLTTCGYSPEISGNSWVYETLLMSEVRIKNKSIFNQALFDSCGFRYDFSAHGDSIQVVHLMFLLRMAEVSSQQHVFRSDLPLYDIISHLALKLFEVGCSIPVVKKQFEGGRGLVRLDHNYDSATCGYSRFEATEQQLRNLATERRTERRTSPTTGQPVY